MVHEIDFNIVGDDVQLVEIELDPKEAVRAEVGSMLYMEEGIEMQTGTGGGIFKGLKRMITGDSFFISSFINQGGGKRKVAFAAPYPGKIIRINPADHGGAFFCQKDGFLCAAQGIEINVAFTKRFGAGLFGGEGFILQKLEGNGNTFIHAGGTIIRRELKQGETLRVDTGCLVGFSPTIDYDIKFVGGFKNALFGGEGLFTALVTGPGLVFLQSLPLSRLAGRILQAGGSFGGREESRGLGGITGGLLGGLISGKE
ncbi:MAG: TIGR00266 family protein [Bacteroidetes bacterium]|nr:TIGR00266 family protein [Bacteroidota bacterium]